MFWILTLTIFVVALVIRALTNRGATIATPDEKLYSTYAAAWRPGRAYFDQITLFLEKPALEIPPTRFAFFALSSLITWGRTSWQTCINRLTWFAVVSGAFAAPLVYVLTKDVRASLLVASAPLSLMLSRRALQDAFAALTVLLALWAVSLQDLRFLAGAIALMLATREALLLFTPAIFAAWVFNGGAWTEGVAGVGGGALTSVGLFHMLGGHQLIGLFRKLGQSTDYVRRFQSGLPHRILVDLVLVSPITTIAGAIACVWAPVWLVVFVLVAVFVHGSINPKNIRFLLVVDLALRMLCAWLPGDWGWVVLGLGLLADFRLYFAIGGCKDPVTYNLVVRTGMYTEPGK